MGIFGEGRRTLQIDSPDVRLGPLERDQVAEAKLDLLVDLSDSHQKTIDSDQETSLSGAVPMDTEQSGRLIRLEKADCFPGRPAEPAPVSLVPVPSRAQLQIGEPSLKIDAMTEISNAGRGRLSLLVRRIYRYTSAISCGIL